MLITLPKVLSIAEVRQFREHLHNAEWQDGLSTAGSLARHVKNNQQLDDSQEPAISLANHILKALACTPAFVSAALPDRIYPPKFNRYRESETYGAHIDAALMQIPGSHLTLRTDLSASLFLADPDEYDGGELCINTQHGTQTVKLAAGDMVLYPSTSLHSVSPITRGVRVAAFFWIQSMVKDIQQRELLFELDNSIQKLTAELGPNHLEVVHLSGLYHNLLRQWATPS
ncbi:Fe2+-dependent dioxygenase [Amphritea sp. 1_MG-2023]|uniref:Fe2+-dependent dioxygenase n=1 Tax=Amphritea sp. 1_MG-2023 TaxID=3062670 RepID=UPI0026E1909B|nr:Fe2+-dependent dioxygenase [Amphritea sp. 1_MG-2023]MDO6564134.1 Fe2+-dependent dioxygenase [Amphritea sp. 1_MG-2023]